MSDPSPRGKSLQKPASLRLYFRLVPFPLSLLLPLLLPLPFRNLDELLELREFYISSAQLNGVLKIFKPRTHFIGKREGREGKGGEGREGYIN